MKVKAKTNIKYNAEWFLTGQTFEAAEADMASLGGVVEVVAEVTAQPAPAVEEKAAEAEKEPVAEEAQEKPKPASTRKRRTVTAE